MITYSKQAQKYLNCTTGKTKNKLDKTIMELSPKRDRDFKSLNKKKRADNIFYHKTEHYRIIYQAQEDNNIHIVNIDTRTNMKMKKYGISN
jgi:mRNA-degrading endonuclease RelE of RelBE toxin-antitoxin system